MVATRASAVVALAASGWALAGVAFGQQPASAVVPAVATIEASVPAPGSPMPAGWMPSRLAGHLADRLQALHEPVAVAEVSPVTHESASAAQLEAAARTPPNLPSESRREAPVTMQPSAPGVALPSAAAQPAELKADQIPSVAPQPAAAPPRNPSPPQQPAFGAANPLRSNR